MALADPRHCGLIGYTDGDILEMIDRLFQNGRGSLLSAIRQALGYSHDNPLGVPDFKLVIISLHHAFEMLLKVVVGAESEGYLRRDFTFGDILAVRKNQLRKPKPKELITFDGALTRAVQLIPGLAKHRSFLSNLNRERNDYYHSFQLSAMDGARIHAENTDEAEKFIRHRDQLIFCQSIPIARELLKLISRGTPKLKQHATTLLDFGRLRIKGRAVDPLGYVASLIKAGRSLAAINGAKRLALAQMYYYPLRDRFPMVARMRWTVNRAVNKAKERDADRCDTCPVCSEKILLWGEHDDDGSFYLTRGECLACGLELGWYVQELFKP